MPSGEPPAADNPSWMSPPTDERRSGGCARQTVEQARPGAKKAGFRTSPGWRSKPRLFHPWSRVAWTVWPAFSGWLFASRRKGFRPAGRAASSRMNKVCFSGAYRRTRSPHAVAPYRGATAWGEKAGKYGQKKPGEMRDGRTGQDMCCSTAVRRRHNTTIITTHAKTQQNHL